MVVNIPKKHKHYKNRSDYKAGIAVLSIGAILVLLPIVLAILYFIYNALSRILDSFIKVSIEKKAK